MNRRKFLQAGVLAGAGMALPRRAAGQSSPYLTPYLDPLPVPPVLRPGPGITEVQMVEFSQQLHRDLPPTRLWGYNGVYPGPTFEVRSGAPIDVRWVSNLPTVHILRPAIDYTLHGANMGEPDVRNVVHLHGVKVLPESDGYPEAWFTPGFAQTGPYFETQVYHYPNDQPATSLWYHDHALGITRLNILAGLAGFYLIRDGLEASLNLPQGAYEIPLMIQDRYFNPDGSLLYPLAVGGTHQVWIPEFFGDTVLVNGKVWPYLEVEPRKYRFRLLNASNARFFHLKLFESTAQGASLGTPGPVIYQIGSDGGLLPAPVPLSDILIAKAERMDLVIDFSGLQGKSFVWLNDAPAPYPGGGEVVPTDVMQFRVSKPLAGADTSSLPDVLRPFPLLDPENAVQVRNLELSELDRASDGFPIIGMLDGVHWNFPVTEDPKAGSIEVWQLVNTTGDAHPIHVHLVQFQILNRQRFNQQAWSRDKRLVFEHLPVPPARNERPADKDTVIALPGMVTRIIHRFDLPTGTPAAPGQRFRYVWHCHILEHEDNEMMRPYDVVG